MHGFGNNNPISKQRCLLFMARCSLTPCIHPLVARWSFPHVHIQKKDKHFQGHLKKIDLFSCQPVWFESKVEKNSACMNATMEHYPDSCHFRDILELIKTRPTTDSWNPSSLTLVKEAYCEKHKKMCFGLQYEWFHLGIGMQNHGIQHHMIQEK